MKTKPTGTQTGLNFEFEAVIQAIHHWAVELTEKRLLVAWDNSTSDAISGVKGRLDQPSFLADLTVFQKMISKLLDLPAMQ